MRIQMLFELKKVSKYVAEMLEDEIRSLSPG